VVLRGHDGAGEASSADVLKGIDILNEETGNVETGVSDRRLTFDLHPTLLGELESFDNNPSLDYVTF
jgi:hypothetical protein